MVVRKCEITGQTFDITDSECEVHKSLDLSLPTLCPEERRRQLLMFCSARRFFWQNCDKSGRRLYSTYPDSCLFPVVSLDFFWSSEWNPLAYGLEYSFQCDFLDQLYKLWIKVPRPAASLKNTSAVRAVQGVFNSSHCFLVFDAHRVEQCSYGVGLWNCKACTDCLNMFDCEQCYECVDCHQCQRLCLADHCYDCTDSLFLSGCRSCRSCMFCANLENKEHCIFNQQMSPADYKAFRDSWDLSLLSKLEEAKNRFGTFLCDFPVPHIVGDRVDSVSGNYLWNCDNCVESYECTNSSDLYHCSGLDNACHCVDGLGFGNKLSDSAQFVASGNGARQLVCCIDCQDDVSNLMYCSHCESSRNLIGCIGLKDAEYCILNKQYNKAVFNVYSERIKKQLKQNVVTGSFFPAKFSPFPYNMSLANEFMTLNRVQAKVFGFSWNESAEVDVMPSQLMGDGDLAMEERFSEVPLKLDNVEIAKLIQQVFLCEMSGRPYQIGAEELENYRFHRIALPTKCFEQRHAERRLKLASYKTSMRKVDDGVVQSAFPLKWRRKVIEHSQWLKGVRQNSQ